MSFCERNECIMTYYMTTTMMIRIINYIPMVAIITTISSCYLSKSVVIEPSESRTSAAKRRGWDGNSKIERRRELSAQREVEIWNGVLIPSFTTRSTSAAVRDVVVHQSVIAHERMIERGSAERPTKRDGTGSQAK